MVWGKTVESIVMKLGFEWWDYTLEAHCGQGRVKKRLKNWVKGLLGKIFGTFGENI